MIPFTKIQALSDLVSSVIQPLAARLYRAEFAKKYGLDSHHGFLVEYETGKDTNLNFHRDDSGNTRPSKLQNM